MKRRLKATLGLVALAALALSISACSGTFSWSISSPAISGSIVDVQGKSTSFSGTTVTLTDTSSGKQYTATVGTSNTWSVSAPNSGTYSVSASNGSKYFFATSGADITYSGTSVTAPPIAGLSTAPLYHSTYSDIVFILMWNNTNNLQLDFSGPDTSVANNIATTLDFTDPSYDPTYDSTAAFVTSWNNGFGPNGHINPTTGALSPLGRLFVNSTSKTIPASSTAPDVALTASTTSGYGPDAITLTNYVTTTSMGFTVAKNAYNQLVLNDTNWQGVGMFYIDAPTSGQYISTTATYNGTTTTAATSTDATIYAVDAFSNGDAHLMGVYKAPTNTNAQTIAALRLNILDQEFQLVPQMATVAWGDIRSVAAPSGVVSAKRGPSK